ncbi:hypothetical protein VHEMI02130 [[Torrubiella] hemipterigena]|uniref:Myb-like domain-containing protein n=1 Tax=[Torrubiella] hemipterigena TaxID=1531966 RepID=A0A0A1SNR2_9HYPO|nr:hypothetical protein VHEMI02130 [[Torrubiella] hemipterigena]
MNDNSWTPFLFDFDVPRSCLNASPTVLYDKTAIQYMNQYKLRESIEFGVHSISGMAVPDDDGSIWLPFLNMPLSYYDCFSQLRGANLASESPTYSNSSILGAEQTLIAPMYPSTTQGWTETSINTPEFGFVRPNEIFSQSNTPSSLGQMCREDSLDVDFDSFNNLDDFDADSSSGSTTATLSSAGSSETVQQSSESDNCLQEPSIKVETVQSISPISPNALRSEKDKFLVQARDSNMTYREIKQQGGFSEAESTLRGRYRALTKEKEARVRKPEWSSIDIVLLRQAIDHFAEGGNIRRAKLPWKKIAEYIEDNGGTYLFGPATCKKKWMSLLPKRRRG